jgi:hypothetical protein
MTTTMVSERRYDEPCSRIEPALKIPVGNERSIRPAVASSITRKNHQLNLNGDDNALSSASGGGGASDLLTIHRRVAVSVEE